MSPSVVIDIATTVAANRATVWRSVSTMDGVNFELHPWVHMSNAADLPVLPSRVVPGDVVLQSWLMLLGVVPFDRHALTLDSIDEGHGFVEVSRSWLHRSWRHERHLTGLPGGCCLVTDRLVIAPRVGLARPVVARAVNALFAHRHRRLIQRFGEGPAEVADAG